MAAATDTFTRTSASSWGSADTGGAYTGNGTATVSTNASQGLMVVATNTAQIEALASVSIRDVVMQVDCFLDVTSPTAECRWYGLLRYVNSTNHARFGVSITTANVIRLDLNRVVAGSATQVVAFATVAGLTNAANRAFTLKCAAVFNGTATDYYSKIWQTGNAEPATWNIVFNDTANATLDVAGGVGVRTNPQTGSGTRTFTFDNLSATIMNGQQVAGALTTAGALAKTASKLLAGTLTSAGVLAKIAKKTLAGTLTSSGALTTIRAYFVSLAGALTSAGSLSKITSKLLSGTLTSSGSLAKVVNKNLTGSLTSAGSLTRSVSKQLVGTLTSSGSLVNLTSKLLAGTLTSSGSLSKIANKSLTGALTSAGSLTKTASKNLAGALTSSGLLTRSVGKSLAGTLSTGGTLSRSVNKQLAGALTSASSLVKIANKCLSGSVASSGSLSKIANKNVAGALTSSGSLTRNVGKNLTGVLDFSGTLSKLIGKSVGGALSFVGTLVRRLTARLGILIGLTGADEHIIELTGADERAVALTGSDDHILTLTGAETMPVQKAITLYINSDHVLNDTIVGTGDISAWTLYGEIRNTTNNEIVLTGTPTVIDGAARTTAWAISAASTLHLTEGAFYQYSIWRVDTGERVPLTYGRCTLLKVA